MTDFSDIPWKNRNSPNAGERQYYKWRLKEWLWETFWKIFWTILMVLMIMFFIGSIGKIQKEKDDNFKNNPEQFCKEYYANTVARDIPGRCLEYFYTR